MVVANSVSACAFKNGVNFLKWILFSTPERYFKTESGNPSENLKKFRKSLLGVRKVKTFPFPFHEKKKKNCPLWIRSVSLWVAMGVETKGEAESGGDLPNKHPICFSDNIWIKLEILVWSQKTRFESSKEIFGEKTIISTYVLCTVLRKEME